jgi:hypothetical protein
MVQLIKNEQRGPAPAGMLKRARYETDLLIGYDGAVVVTRFDGLLVRQRRIKLNPHKTRSSRPLCA